MATRLKTVQWAPDRLATVTDNTFVDFAQFTIYIPESSPTFRKATVEIIVRDDATSAANVTARQSRLRLGASAYTNSALSGTYTNSGEKVIPNWTADFVARFTTSWTGTSMTCDIGMDFDSAGTTPLWRDATARLALTYEYDDTSSTHIKSVYIPLNAPTSALATSKPGTAVATIPALDTFCPEASKTFRQIFIVVEGNVESTSTTDWTVTQQIDTLGTRVTGTIESALNSSPWWRYIYDVTGLFTTNATHNYFIWASTGKCGHQQIYMIVTYEYNEASTTTVLNSIILPMEVDSPMGNTSSDWQRASRSIYIEEPTTITIQQSALFYFWEQATAISGIGVRAYNGTPPSFPSEFSSVATSVSGSEGAMLRCESDMTLARGKNDLIADFYNSDTADLGWNVSGYWMLNYTSGKATGGTSTHNHTVFWNLATNAINSINQTVVSATNVIIPASEYFLSAIGVRYIYLTNTTGNAAAVSVKTERLVAEGGFTWENVYLDGAHTDPESGIHYCYSTARSLFKRWNGDDNNDRMDIETARRWYVGLPAASWNHLDLILTYHSISFSKTQTITGSGGGTVNVNLYRLLNNEKVRAFSRSGNGTIDLIWFDDVETMYAAALEDATHMGRSDNFTFA